MHLSLKIWWLYVILTEYVCKFTQIFFDLNQIKRKISQKAHFLEKCKALYRLKIYIQKKEAFVIYLSIIWQF